MKRLLNLSGARVLALVFVTVVFVFSVSSCNGGIVPTAPIVPGNLDMSITSPAGGEIFIANEQVTIAWEMDSQVLDLIDHFKVYYSVDSGNEWKAVGRYTSAPPIHWIIPMGIDSSNCLLKVEGWNSSCPTVPTVRAIGNKFSIVPFGDLDHFEVIAPDEIYSGEPFVLVIIAVDRFGNLVKSFSSDILLAFIIKAGAGAIAPTSMGLESTGWNDGEIVTDYIVLDSLDVLDNQIMLCIIIQCSGFDLVSEVEISFMLL